MNKVIQMGKRKKFERIFNKNKPGGYVEVLVKELNKPAFIGALSKLDNCTKFPNAQTAWNVMKLTKQCYDAIKDQRTLYTKMVKEYAKLDETGEIMLTDSKEIVYKDEASEKEHQAKFDDFMETKIKLEGSPLPLQALDAAALSPIELDALSPMLDKSTL